MLMLTRALPYLGILLALSVTTYAFSITQRPLQLVPHPSADRFTTTPDTVLKGQPLFIASSQAMNASEDELDQHHPVTKVKRTINALRATMRAATGISLTAMYVSLVAFTSSWVRGTMTFILARFPTWFRYFLQPFLILYYVPLYMLRTWTSPKKRKERRALHTEIMDDVKRGVLAADAAMESGYWPFQLTDTGVTATFPPELEEDDDSELKP